jgi:hypothetical protein
MKELGMWERNRWREEAERLDIHELHGKMELEMVITNKDQFYQKVQEIMTDIEGNVEWVICRDDLFSETVFREYHK